jgi:hypothetical protein
MLRLPIWALFSTRGRKCANKGSEIGKTYFHDTLWYVSHPEVRHHISFGLSNTLMDEEVLLYQLEELAEKLEILVRDENINIEESSSAGGLCRIEGKYVLILNSKAIVKEKIQVMVKALRQLDLSDIYIKPVIRELLEGYDK